MKPLNIEGRKIGPEHPTYFIADIAANHDGDLKRAEDLIYLAAEAGANAAKFQHFAARTIVSDYGFRALGGQQSHQAQWKKSVFEVYQDASLNPAWTETLKNACKKSGIHFFTSPYSKDLVDEVDPHVCAYKIGSGDITYTSLIEHICKKGKPVLLASGASTIEDVSRAMGLIQKYTDQVSLMQCNTNYTGSIENMRYVQLRVLESYRKLFPNIVLGLSDHTPGHASVLGAVTLGARTIEKHFTDDTQRQGPDHGFSMDPKSWREMVLRTRELEAALGEPVKKIEENERETAILQRRSVRFSKDLPKGTRLTAEMLEALRPCPLDGLAPYQQSDIEGQVLTQDVKRGQHVTWNDLSSSQS